MNPVSPAVPNALTRMTVLLQDPFYGRFQRLDDESLLGRTSR